MYFLDESSKLSTKNVWERGAQEPWVLQTSIAWLCEGGALREDLLTIFTSMRLVEKTLNAFWGVAYI